MNSVNKLGLALTVIFVISLLLLSLQILYLLWRKRRFSVGHIRHVEFGGGGGDHHHQASTQPPSKELLYFFCWKNYQASRIEPADSSATAVAVSTTASAPTEDEELEEMLKLQELYSASRALFTIKEESEKEEMENDTASSFPKNGTVLTKKDQDKVMTDVGQLEETETAALTVTETVVVIEVDDDEDFDEDDDEVRLFMTPCASPPYYTPSPSPPREDRDGAVSSGSYLITTDKIAGR